MRADLRAWLCLNLCICVSIPRESQHSARTLLLFPDVFSFLQCQVWWKIWQLHTNAWFEGCRQHSGQKSHGLVIQNCCVVTQLFLTSCIAGWRKSRWFWEKALQSGMHPFLSTILLTESECSNWEKCNRLWIPWNHIHSILAKDPEWACTEVLGFLKLVLVPLTHRVFSVMSQKTDIPLQMCMNHIDYLFVLHITVYTQKYCNIRNLFWCSSFCINIIKNMLMLASKSQKDFLLRPQLWPLVT